MGKNTLGIMYGVVIPRAELYDEEELGYPLFDKAYDYFSKKIDAVKNLDDYEMAQSRYIPEFNVHDGKMLIGFWVAVGASGKGGIPYLGDGFLPMDDIGQNPEFKKSLKKAQDRWNRFDNWASREIIFPPADTWLAQTEVA